MNNKNLTTMEWLQLGINKNILNKKDVDQLFNIVRIAYNEWAKYDLLETIKCQEFSYTIPMSIIKHYDKEWLDKARGCIIHGSYIEEIKALVDEHLTDEELELRLNNPDYDYECMYAMLNEIAQTLYNDYEIEQAQEADNESY